TLDVNQVVLFPLTDRLTGEVSLQRQDDPRGLRKTTVSIAPVLVIGQYNYVIFRYGLGILDAGLPPATSPDERAVSHGLTIDANRETESLYLNLSVHGEYYPIDGFWFLLPTVAARAPLTERLSLLGRYFFSYSSDETLGNAVLTEFSWPLSDQLSVKAGGTVSVESVRTAGSGSPYNNEWSVTGISGGAYAVTPALSLRYHLEYIGRFGAPDGIRNILVLDASF
ncbi:MAG: hypothetical protein EA383_14160, partial [Spirochaetaceae bacterium]